MLFLMYHDPFSSLKFNVLAVVVVMLAGALLLFLILKYAFSVTGGLLEATPRIE